MTKIYQVRILHEFPQLQIRFVCDDIYFIIYYYYYHIIIIIIIIIIFVKCYIWSMALYGAET